MFSYLCTAVYDKAADAGVRWDDPAIGIGWPITEPQLSAKDALAPLLQDVAADRLHPTKRFRPVAAGDIPVGMARVIGGAAIVASVLLGLLINWHLAVVLGAYVVLTTAYSTCSAKSAATTGQSQAIACTARPT